MKTAAAGPERASQFPPRMRGGGAFTLIELLIVVAIIAILAAIAVPNFLDAQTRAKAARSVAELRTVATALEAYRVDNNEYPPNDGNFSVLPIFITTPIAYITSSGLIDSFSEHELDPIGGELIRFYTYQKIIWHTEYAEAFFAGVGAPFEAIDADDPGDCGFCSNVNIGALEKYGPWKILSYGPDRKYSDQARFTTDIPLLGSDIPYDPTNGIVSWGNIIRTQKGEARFVK